MQPGQKPRRLFRRSAGALCLSFALAAGSPTASTQNLQTGLPHQAALLSSSGTTLALVAAQVPPAPPPLPSIPVVTPETRDFPCRSAFVMDINGQVIAQEDPDGKRYPASITKVMTMILVFDALRDGTLKLDDRITFSANAAGKSRTNMGVSAGTTITVEDGIKALAVHSANDVATAFAERLKGSESRFATAMTAKAHSIGMDDTTFKNANGLPTGRAATRKRKAVPDAQMTTARDIARMSQYLIQEYPDYYPYFAEQTFTWRGTTYRNHNKSLGVYPGVDGIKTGYIRASMFNIAASAVRPEGRLIVALFGCPSTPARTRELESLLDLGFEALRKQQAGAVPVIPVLEQRP